MITAKVVADSKHAKYNHRITSMVVTFPRYILAELNTHRMFSRNSASSRAIPFEKLLKSVQTNPFIPIAWMKDHKGMQGTEYFEFEPDIIDCEHAWLGARDYAVERAIALSEKGATKQMINRLLEPFMWHTVIITATEWENFFALRCPRYNINGTYYRSKKDAIARWPQDAKYTDVLDWLRINEGQADIHMMALAEAMWDALNESTPKVLQPGEWHIPFGDDIDYYELGKYQIDNNLELTADVANVLAVKIATARAARVSYTVVGEEGKPANYEADIKLHDRLVASGHMSPTEHCAKAMDDDEYFENVSGKRYADGDDDHAAYRMEHGCLGWSGNFCGFVQYRKLIPNENIYQNA